MSEIGNLFVLAVLWAAYGACHSLLAARGMKAWAAQAFPRLWPAYRLLYNGIALVCLVPPLWWASQVPGPIWWQPPAWLSWAALGLGGIGLLWSLRWYDGATFLGLRQWRKRIGPDDQIEAFTISPLHRFVRHPWYFLVLLVLWTRELNAAWLVSALMISLYFIVGSRLEENKLMAAYGEAYRAYCRRVPGLLPRPWRYLRRREAQSLERAARARAQVSS